MRQKFSLTYFGYPSCRYLGRLPDTQNSDPQTLSCIKELSRKNRKVRSASVQVGNPENRLNFRNFLLTAIAFTG